MARGRKGNGSQEPPVAERAAGPELQEAHEAHNLAALDANIIDGFEKLYDAEAEIALAVKEHIDPLRAGRKKIWKELDEGTDIEREDLELFYKLYKRQRAAKSMENEVDRQRVARNLKTIFNALAKNQQLDFIEAVQPGVSTPASAAQLETPQRAAPGYIAQLGREAFKEGRSFDTCSYPKGSAARDEWEQGFHEAMAKAEAAKGTPAEGAAPAQ